LGKDKLGITFSKSNNANSLHENCRQYKSKLTELCDKHNVKELNLPGSVLTDKFNKNMLIQFDKVELLHYFDNYMDLNEKLKQLFHRKIDLAKNQAVRNPIFRKILYREK
jgi:predicted nucleotidyltransferase